MLKLPVIVSHLIPVTREIIICPCHQYCSRFTRAHSLLSYSESSSLDSKLPPALQGLSQRPDTPAYNLLSWQGCPSRINLETPTFQSANEMNTTPVFANTPYRRPKLLHKDEQQKEMPRISRKLWPLICCFMLLAMSKTLVQVEYQSSSNPPAPHTHITTVATIQLQLRFLRNPTMLSYGYLRSHKNHK